MLKSFDRFLDGVLKEEHVKRRKRGGVNEEMKDFGDVLLDLEENNVTSVPCILTIADSIHSG